MVALIDNCCGGGLGSVLREELPAAKTDDTDEDVMECNYDKDLTPLYQMIEEQVWFAAYEFLALSEPGNSAAGESPREQAATWVSRYEESGKLRWSQLPLHGAIIFKAPFKVVEALIKLYPKALKSRDDQEMLPLHLAYRYGVSDSVLALILDGYPEAIGVKGKKGKLPHECAARGPNPRRGEIIQEYIDQMAEGALVYERNRYLMEQKNQRGAAVADEKSHKAVRHKPPVQCPARPEIGPNAEKPVDESRHEAEAEEKKDVDDGAADEAAGEAPTPSDALEEAREAVDLPLGTMPDEEVEPVKDKPKEETDEAVIAKQASTEEPVAEDKAEEPVKEEGKPEVIKPAAEPATTTTTKSETKKTKSKKSLRKMFSRKKK